MLRIIQSTSSAQAKSYYSTADYYLANEQELAGQWRGEGARLLGLDGKVHQAEWESLCDNRNPQTGERITSRQRADRTIGYDFNFHVPKSVSLLYVATRDERLLEAFRESVDATMQDIEAETQARVRKSGKNENRQTGNLAWGEFIHFTSRPVDGVPDPHLHAHCFVHNVTFDAQEEKWKAGQFQDLKRDAPYFEALFHSRLAHKLTDLGLPVERTAKGWELAGIDKGFVRKFSRRTKLIEDKAREMGIDSAQAKDGLGAKTREHKQKDLSFAELQQSWNDRMSQPERNALAALAKRIGGRPQPADGDAARRSVEYAMDHEFERKSVVPERMLLARALKHSVGKATVDQVRRDANKADLIVATRNGRRMVTSRRVLAEEKRLVDFARKGRGTCRPFARKLDSYRRDFLNNDQKRAVKHIVESRDRVILLRGKAGVGKTTLLQEAKDVIEHSGTKVFAFAPSAEASRGVLRTDGFADADTVAMLLKDERKQRQAAGNLILIDEAGQVGSRTMAEVFSLAERINARVLLSGDRYQHASVERGAALRLLEEEAGIVPAEVKEIQRQSGKYKLAVKAISDGHVAEGFKRLDELGWIVEAPGLDRYQRIAADYVEAVAAGKTTLVIAPTHAEGDRLTAAIRNRLRDEGELGKNEQTFRVLQNANLTEAERGDETSYIPGHDVLVFHQNAKGFTRGQRVEVSPGKSLPLDQKSRFQVFHTGELSLAAGDQIRITRNGFTADGKHRLDNGALYKVKAFDAAGNIVLANGWAVAKDYGFLDYGHVVTSYASQGRTVQRVFVAQGHESMPASSLEQFYVSASRGKERVTIYTGNKRELLEAVSKSDERITAMELVGGNGLPPLPPEPLRGRGDLAVSAGRELQELEYER
ncbi:MAG: relaxase domain-containing protein [Pirellulales bacterium]|nr:relaxase domain-containing protein [Pirellulales bacterium]